VSAEAKRRGARRREPIVVGWNEYVDLPAWGIHGVHAKIDTGARSTSLHVAEFTLLDDDRIRFDVPHGLPSRRHETVVADIARVSHVRSSNGQQQLRYFVRTDLTLGGYTRAVELNLVDRGDMRFPMLIGRTALAKRYLVNPGRRCLASQRPDA